MINEIGYRFFNRYNLRPIDISISQRSLKAERGYFIFHPDMKLNPYIVISMDRVNRATVIHELTHYFLFCRYIGFGEIEKIMQHGKEFKYLYKKFKREIT
jgi:predicted SprT family Zn-dependent metalloprotease